MAELPKNLKEQFRPEKLPSGMPWRLFIFIALFTLAVALVYAGLSFGYRPYLESRISEVDQQISQLGAAISKQDQENFVRFYSQLINFNKILEKHPLPSKIFLLLEQATNKKVAYTNVDLRVGEKKLTLEGIAASYTTLAEQLASYDQSPAVASSLLNQSQYSDTDNAVRFKVTLMLKDGVLK